MTSRPGLPDPEGEHLLVLARDPEGYRRLCQVISTAQLAGGEKGRPWYDPRTLADALGDYVRRLTPAARPASA